MEKGAAFDLLALFGVLIMVIIGITFTVFEMLGEQEVVDSDAVLLASSDVPRGQEIIDPYAALLASSGLSADECFGPGMHCDACEGTSCYETYGPGRDCVWCCFLKYFCEMDAGHSEGTSMIHLIQCLNQCLESTPVVPY